MQKDIRPPPQQIFTDSFFGIQEGIGKPLIYIIGDEIALRVG